MFKLMVGNVWQVEQLEHIQMLNEKHDGEGICVAELYGSQRATHNPLGTARPDHRLPEVDDRKLADFVKSANDIGLLINYTLNAPVIGSVLSIAERIKSGEIPEFLQALEAAGVSRITFAHPIVAELVTEYTDIPLEASTILHINSVAQIPKLKAMGVTKVCMDIYRNRDMQFLMNFTAHAEKHGIDVELLANEFCTIDGAPCHGLYRDSCYVTHAMGGNEEKQLDNYPMGRCMLSRERRDSSWLKARFILPQWMQEYERHTGITHFKISGRTAPLEYIKWITEVYMNQAHFGSVRDLWFQLQNIGENEADMTHKFEYVDGAYLRDAKFIEHWLQNPEFDCATHCSYDCTFCDQVYHEWTKKNG